jgi:hypothetical protein
LKKNKIFLYINPKPGLKHFLAIGVLFGPNPEYIWRDELAALLVETIRSEVNNDEAEQLGRTSDNKPKIILSLNNQTIGTSTPEKISSVALEIRVPSGKERIYIGILERLFEKAENEEIIIPTTLGKFCRGIQFSNATTKCRYGQNDGHPNLWLHKRSSESSDKN